MEIGGFLKQSLIDFPGNITSVLFTKGCNFRCKYCHNPELVIPELIIKQPSFSEEEVLLYLNKYKHLLDAVSITGGEPCIQEDLVSFISKVKSLDLLIKLDTNGTFPDKVKELIDNNLVDYFAMDIKAPLKYINYGNIIGSDFINKSLIKKVIETKNLIVNSGIPFEFRTTVVKGLISKEDIISISKEIDGKWFLQLFSNNKILEKENISYTSYTREELRKILSTTNKNGEEIEIR